MYMYNVTLFNVPSYRLNYLRIIDNKYLAGKLRDNNYVKRRSLLALRII